ncbi:MAG: hypothetical protein MJ212_02755 [Alphaproteobacteria bacterium]|nr:hypothetical protein [Alphaproteobacteria bacterium]
MEIFKKIAGIYHRLNWHFDMFNVAESAILIMVFPLMYWGSSQWFYENSIVENLQLVTLIIAMYVCLTAKQHRKLFVFFAFIALFCILREVNMGRGIFCHIYFKDAVRCRWTMFQYGYLADVVWGCLIATVVWYVFKYNLLKSLRQYIMYAPIYIWDILFLVISALLAEYSEFDSVGNEIMEETAEAAMYITYAICLHKYKRVNV